jgi:pimeloyl-ACP methyl ester carboxylesterase
VIAGADDAFVPALYLDDFASTIPRARSVSIADAAHMVPYERMDDVHRAVVEHVG